MTIIEPLPPLVKVGVTIKASSTVILLAVIVIVGVTWLTVKVIGPAVPLK